MSLKPQSKSKRYSIRISTRAVLNEEKEVIGRVPMITLFSDAVPSRKNVNVVRIGSLGAKAVHEGFVSSSLEDLAKVRSLSEKEFAKQVAMFNAGDDACTLNESIVYSNFIGIYKNITTNSYFCYGVLRFRSPFTGAKIELSSADYDLDEYITEESLAQAKVIDTPAFLKAKPETEEDGDDDEIPLEKPKPTGDGSQNA